MIYKNDLLGFTVKRNNKVYRALVMYVSDNKYAIDYLGLSLDIDILDNIIIEDNEGYVVEADVLDVNNEEGIALIEVIDGKLKPKRVQASINVAIKYNEEIIEAKILETSKEEMIVTTDTSMSLGSNIAGIIKYGKMSIKFKAVIDRANTIGDKRYLLKYTLMNTDEYSNIEDIFNEYMNTGKYGDAKLRR